MYCQELQDAIQDHESNLDYINNTGRDLVQKGGSEERISKLKTELQKLNQRFEGIARGVEERLTEIELTIEQMKQYQVCVI